MLHTLINWLKFDVQNIIPEVWWCVLILWTAILIFSAIDIFGNVFGPAAKAGWMAGILLLPLLGLFAYCIYCLSRADYYMLDFLTKKRNSPRQKLKASSN